MKLEEKHKQFVVKRFARFMKIQDIVTEFVEEFQHDLYGIFKEHLSTMLLSSKLSTLFRRLNITHSQFPEKYKELFYQERENYLANYRDASLHIPDNVIRELEALYGLTRELAHEQRDAKYITLALQILKSIVACNTVNAQEDVIEITPEAGKQLATTAKTLASQVKKESRQLENMANQN